MEHDQEYTYIAMRVINNKVEYLTHVIRKRKLTGGLTLRIWKSDAKKLKYLTLDECYDILNRVKDVIIQRIDL